MSKSKRFLGLDENQQFVILGHGSMHELTPLQAYVWETLAADGSFMTTLSALAIQFSLTIEVVSLQLQDLMDKDFPMEIQW